MSLLRNEAVEQGQPDKQGKKVCFFSAFRLPLDKQLCELLMWGPGGAKLFLNDLLIARGMPEAIKVREKRE